MKRKASITRKTKETKIDVELNIDGKGQYKINTGIGFLDHMLEQLSKHSSIDLKVKAKGDTHIVLPESHNKDTVIQDLLQGEPMISVAPSETENALLLNPMTVKDGEPSIIKERILEVMG